MAAKEKDGAAIRKRALIAKSNKTMFIMVACASVVVSVSIVGGIMMLQKMMHMNKVLGELNSTKKVLTDNLANVTTLQDSIRALGSEEALLRLRTDQSGNANALRVILDALPADLNPSALGASIQQVLLQGDNVESLSIEGGEVETELAEATTDSTGDGTDSEATAGVTTNLHIININFTISGDENKLREALERLERSIRTIRVTRVSVTSAGENSPATMTVQAVAYYQPAVQLTLDTKEVAP